MTSLFIYFLIGSGDFIPVGVKIVSGNLNGIATDDNKFLLGGEIHRLFAVLVIHNQKGDTFYVTEAKNIRIKGKQIDSRKLINPTKMKLSEKPKLRWYKVENVKTNYENSNKNKGWWAKIQYTETPWIEDEWVVIADVRPTILKGAPDGKNFGTMRYKLEVELGGRVLKTPGKESIDIRGIKDNVFRISIGRDSTIVGISYGFFNLPYIRGSASLVDQNPPEFHQAERFIGFDCADFITAVIRRFSGIDLKYGSSYSFRNDPEYKKILKTIVPRAILKNDVFVMPYSDSVIKVGEGGIIPGDILLYNGHVGIFTRDTSQVGILDKDDLHIHTCFDEPKEEPLISGYGNSFTILRLTTP